MCTFPKVEASVEGWRVQIGKFIIFVTGKGERSITCVSVINAPGDFLNFFSSILINRFICRIC